MNASAIGTDNQIPSIPQRCGSNKIAPVRNTKVRPKEMTADNNPLDKEVNRALEKVLNPTKKSAMENKRFP